MRDNLPLYEDDDYLDRHLGSRLLGYTVLFVLLLMGVFAWIGVFSLVRLIWRGLF